MPSVCAVDGCKNTSREQNTTIFHRFPTKSKTITKAWSKICKPKLNYKTARVCSVHFETKDYEHDMEHELLGLPPRKRLKTDAIPKKCDPETSQILLPIITKRDERANTRTRKRTVAEAMMDDNNCCNESMMDNLQEPEDESLLEDSLTIDQKICELENEIEYLRKYTEWQKSTILKSQCQIRKLNTSLSKSKLLVTTQRKTIKRLTDLKKTSLIGKVFSQTQQKKLLSQSRVQWTQQDIVKALTVRSVSLKAYETAREKWGLPLPCTRTLRNWVHRFTCSPGIQTDVLQILKEKATNLSVLSKLCVLSYDEMSVCATVVHDITSDSIYSNSKVQVSMVRGLCEKWKQPVYFDFDKSMTETLLKEIITKIYQAGLIVVAVVCDLGGENRSVLNSLGINEEVVSFKHPCDINLEVFVFPDGPHLLKLLRNHVVDDGVYFEDGTIINKEFLEELLLKDSSELNLCPKIDINHLYVKGAERMNVRFAARFFSRHMFALSSRHYPNVPTAGKLFLTVNDGFDVMNSRTRTDTKNPLKSGYDFENVDQDKALSDLELLVKSMKFMKECSKKTVGPPNLSDITKKPLPCQKGYLIAIKALKKMGAYLREKYDVKYILTSRINQDCLESFFSRIRAFGGGNNPCPTPPEFRYRMRLILLGSEIRAPKGTNTEYDDGISYVSASLISKNKLPVQAQSSGAVQTTIVSDTEQRILSNPKEAGSLTTSLDDTTKESLRYLAGYIAWRLKRKNLGIYGLPTSKVPFSNEESTDNWIHSLSRGGLLVPNDYILNNVKKSENLFESMYIKYSRCNSISVHMLNGILNEDSTLDPIIVKEFIAIRLRIRVRQLNRNRVKKINANKNKQFLKSRK